MLAIRIDVHHHFDGPAPSPNLLGDILQLLRQINERTMTMSQAVIDLNAKVAELEQTVADETTVIGSAVTLLNGLGAQIQGILDDQNAIGVDTTKLQALKDAISANDASLAAAVAANTPAAP